MQVKALRRVGILTLFLDLFALKMQRSLGSRFLSRQQRSDCEPLVDTLLLKRLA